VMMNTRKRAANSNDIIAGKDSIRRRMDEGVDAASSCGSWFSAISLLSGTAGNSTWLSELLGQIERDVLIHAGHHGHLIRGQFFNHALNQDLRG